MQLASFTALLEAELAEAKARLDAEGVGDPAVAASLVMVQKNAGTARRNADTIAQAFEGAVFRPRTTAGRA